MRQSVKGSLVEATLNCRICGLDTAGGQAWKDANGYQYCNNCLDDLRRQPPYQSPLFKCGGCGHAWPLKALAERRGELVCKDCLSSPPTASASADGNKPRLAAGVMTQKLSVPKSDPVKKESAKYTLGPPPSNILSRVTCPHCWHVFPTDQLLFVSQHGELQGDPVLGPEAPLRFRPSRFNLQGEALDAHDVPCQTLACPRCHLSIARSMTQTAPLFMSIIGAPASGKSHFLASMTWELRRVLAEKFAVSFNDADASTNHTLNEYEQTLFLQDDMNRLVSIRKTELQGELYDQIRLGEQVINLPKPFLFTLRPGDKAASVDGDMRMVCLYDNAGEHFQPGMDTLTLPGTQHMAKSRVLWFMYDPTQHPRFREQCRSLSHDPQVFGSARTLRQEVLLNEAASRIRRYTGLSAQQKYDRPLVVIVSKADIWGQLLGINLARGPIVPAGDGAWAVDSERVEKISAALRKLLMMLSPEFVTAAEDFCKHVIYLPVSALGRGPEVQAETGMLAIRPRDIRPQWATVPFLYMFAMWSPGLIPGVRVATSSEHLPATPESRTVILSPHVPIPVPGAAAATAAEMRAHYELVYTSAPRGLRPGSSGFCTVAMSSGMPTALVDRLESLSSYQPIFQPGSEHASKNPVVFAHWRVPVGGRASSVLSRIEFAGLDYTQRPNKLAYHIVVDPAQQPPPGPLWTMLQPGVMQNRWSGEPVLWQNSKSLPMNEIRPGGCAAWKAATGDPGWAGILAETFLLEPSKVSYLIYAPPFDPLPLLAEAAGLLAPRLRWYLTFNTYFAELPAGLACTWRCVVAGTPAAKDAVRHASSGLILDLTRRLGLAPNRAAARNAREGRMLQIPSSPKAVVVRRPAPVPAKPSDTGRHPVDGEMMF